jgi:hypothetical protein
MLSDILAEDREELRTFCTLVEVAVLDSSERNRRMFAMHIRDRYPRVERLFTREGCVYADFHLPDGHHAVPVLQVPTEYLGTRATPVDIDLTKILQ